MSDAMIGAGSALGGVVVAGVFGLILDHRRRQWDDERRWQDPRRRAYAELLFTARYTFAAACRGTRLAAERGIEAAVSNSEVGFTNDEVHGWMRRANEASAEVLLIASEPVRDAATELMDVHRDLGDLLKAMFAGEAGPGEELKPCVDEIEEREQTARTRFWKAARVELGIDG
jgi:hypothetical protein